jgi:CheY-like chemotaxis protein
MIARRLLTLMGGTLTFDSPGLKRGTSVVARLPALKAAELAQVASRPAEGPLPDGNRGPLRILLVEDDPGTARAAALSLRRLGGHEVTVSEDVPEILRLTAEGRIDAVLMDVSLATSSYQGRLVDGLEITRLLRADSRSRAIPVLLMTAHAMAGDRERMLQASGAEGYESKPVEDYRRLMDRLQGLVSQRRAAS